MQLVMDLPFHPSESRAAEGAAQELLAKLNAIAQILDGNHVNVRIVGIARRNPSGGPMDQFIHMAASTGDRSRVGFPGIVTGAETTNPPQKKIGDQFWGLPIRAPISTALYSFLALSL